MAKYTAELRTIINNSLNIFDFEYTRTAESQAIISDDDLQNGFIEHFYFNEVGFETLERFKQRLKTQWKESLGEFDALLVAYAQPVEAKANLGSNSDNLSIFNDTPKSALDYGEESSHASSIATNKQNNKGFAGITEIEMLELYHDKIKDIQTEFYESFRNLFMQIF